MAYGFDTDRSRELSERLQKSLPGGDTRSITYYAPYPLGMARGSGYRLWDVDGNEFVDLLNNYTALVHGHAHPVIVEAIREQAPLGTAFPAPTELQAELAERVCRWFEAVDLVRFTNSGSEGDIMAIRAARAYTGREEIVKADGGYHGLWEQVPMSWGVQHGRVGAGDDTLPGEAWDTAIPKGVRELVHMIDFNDVEQLETIMTARGERVAALIFEPVLGEGVVAGSPEFFRRARELADEYGALLIIDEVVTQRLHPGGYQAVLGVRADLTVVGKIIGGGLPVGGFGGRADVMELFDPRLSAYVAHAGTFNGNPLTMAAGCASLDLLTPSEVERINRLGAQLAGGLREALAANGLEATITDCGSLVHIHFEAAEGIRSFRDVNLHSPMLLRLHAAALEQGLYIAPRGTLNVSTAMDESAVEVAVGRLGRAVQTVAEAADVGVA
jgi:glutamate-1-semialdehyde 2,1-aminomutase